MALNYKFRLILGCFFCVLGLMACGVSDEPELDLPPLDLPEPATPVFSGSCDDNSILEAWLQTTHFQQRDFVTLMEGSVGEDHDSQVLYQNIEEMGLYRNRISDEPAPDCTESVHIELLRIMQSVLDQFQAYVNGDDIDLVVAVETARIEFNALLPQQTELFNRLDSQYGN